MIEPRLADASVRFLPATLPSRIPHTSSRIVVLKDGRFLPVLSLLAEWKFGTEWNRRSHFAFWLDGDPENETLGNVDLATRVPLRRLNIPFGPDYHKRRRQLLKTEGLS